MVGKGTMVVKLLLIFGLFQILTKAQALPSNTLSFQGPVSWITNFRGMHIGYEKRLGNYSALAKISGYWWDERMSLLDSNDQQILGYSANISGKHFLSLKKMYYVEASGSFTSFNKWLTGEDFHYASVGGFFGRKFRINWFSVDLNLGFMIPFKSPDQLKEEDIGAHPSVLPFSIFGEIAKVMMKNIMPNSFYEANLAFGYNF